MRRGPQFARLCLHANALVILPVLDKLHTKYTPNTSNPIQFFHLLARLKSTPRAGWVRFGIARPESIAAHMYRMSIMTMAAPASLTSRLDLARCTRMALVHDMAESIVGDITPVDGISKMEKNRREAETIDFLCGPDGLLAGYEGGLSGQEIRKLWLEYEDNKTIEARFVHDIDKIELVLQMVEYEREHEGALDLGEFTWVAARIELDEVKDWARIVLTERKRFWDTVGKEPTWHADTKPGDTRDTAS